MNCKCVICERLKTFNDLIKRTEKLNDREFLKKMCNDLICAEFEVECLQRAVENYKTRISDMKVVHHE